MQVLLARAMREMLLLASLALLSRVPSSVGASPEYEYDYSTRGYEQSPCWDIPEDMQLCYGIGYHKMVLPNLLDHDTMEEVKQHASIWVPLKKCHPGMQVLLCSLLAPVCFKYPVPPCRILCEAVRDDCSPVMELFSYPWPDMLNCSRFPFEEEEMCISFNQTESGHTKKHVSACPQCDIEMNVEAVLGNLCAGAVVHHMLQ